jgi:hypothetical protein
MPRTQFQACALLIGTLLLHELQKSLEKKERRKRVWIKKWIRRRNLYGASNTLLKELAQEDPSEHRRHLRMSPRKFVELLAMIEPYICKDDIAMRMAIPTRTKLQITLCYLASGDSFRTLHHLYTVPVNTISCFLPEVLTAIFNRLRSYVKVR